MSMNPIKADYIVRISTKERNPRKVTIVEVVDAENNQVHFGVAVQHSGDQHNKKIGVNCALARVVENDAVLTVPYDPANPKEHRLQLLNLVRSIEQNPQTIRDLLSSQRQVKRERKIQTALFKKLENSFVIKNIEASSTPTA